MTEPYVTVDIAHPPMTAPEAELELDRQIRRPGARALKIIHGYGSRGGEGVLKDLVRGWTHRRRDRLTAVIHGEDLGLHNRTIEALIKTLRLNDPDLLRANAGITVVWIR